MSTKEERHKRAEEWAIGWKQRTGEGPGRAGYMQAYLCGYFDHPMTSSRPLSMSIFEQFEELEDQLATMSKNVAIHQTNATEGWIQADIYSHQLALESNRHQAELQIKRKSFEVIAASEYELRKSVVKLEQQLIQQKQFWESWFCKAHLPFHKHATGTCFVCNMSKAISQEQLRLESCYKHGKEFYGATHFEYECPKCLGTGMGTGLGIEARCTDCKASGKLVGITHECTACLEEKLKLQDNGKLCLTSGCLNPVEEGSPFCGHCEVPVMKTEQQIERESEHELWARGYNDGITSLGAVLNGAPIDNLPVGSQQLAQRWIKAHAECWLIKYKRQEAEIGRLGVELVTAMSTIARLEKHPESSEQKVNKLVLSLKALVEQFHVYQNGWVGAGVWYNRIGLQDDLKNAEDALANATVGRSPKPMKGLYCSVCYGLSEPAARCSHCNRTGIEPEPKG